MTTKLSRSSFQFYLQNALTKVCALQFKTKSQYRNYLAIQLLEEMGNRCPIQADIDHMENQLAHVQTNLVSSSKPITTKLKADQDTRI